VGSAQIRRSRLGHREARALAGELGDTDGAQVGARRAGEEAGDEVTIAGGGYDGQPGVVGAEEKDALGEVLVDEVVLQALGEELAQGAALAQGVGGIRDERGQGACAAVRPPGAEGEGRDDEREGEREAEEAARSQGRRSTR
jgi:hypothetical protein